MEKKIKKAARAMLLESDQLKQLPPVDEDEMLAAMTEAAMRGKARRRSTVIVSRLEQAFSARAIRIAAPALCAFAVAIALFALLGQPVLPYQAYDSAILPPVETVRGDAGEWLAGGWAENAVPDGWTAQDSYLAAGGQLVCLYQKDGRFARVTVSPNDIPLYVLLMDGESRDVQGTAVWFGKDESMNLHSAVWQKDGLTVSVVTDGTSKQLLRLVKEVINYEE